MKLGLELPVHLGDQLMGTTMGRPQCQTMVKSGTGNGVRVEYTFWQEVHAIPASMLFVLPWVLHGYS